jgi:hypothetical protein
VHVKKTRSDKGKPNKKRVKRKKNSETDAPISKGASDSPFLNSETDAPISEINGEWESREMVNDKAGDFSPTILMDSYIQKETKIKETNGGGSETDLQATLNHKNSNMRTAGPQPVPPPPSLATHKEQIAPVIDLFAKVMDKRPEEVLEDIAAKQTNVNEVFHGLTYAIKNKARKLSAYLFGKRNPGTELFKNGVFVAKNGAGNLPLPTLYVWWQSLSPQQQTDGLNWIKKYRNVVLPTLFLPPQQQWFVPDFQVCMAELYALYQQAARR